MSQKVANIAKNTSYFTLALILQKVISLSYFVIIARAVGPVDLGKYYFAISLTTMFAILIDLGFANVLMREVPRRKEEAEKILGTVLAAKIPLALVSLFAVILFVNLAGYPQLTKTLVYISCASMLLDSFTLAINSAIRGFHNLVYESIGSIIFQAIVLVSGLIVLEIGGGLKFLMVGLVLASIFNFVYSSSIALFKFKLKPIPIFDSERIRAIALLAIPFSLYAILQRGYTYLDSIFLSLFSGDMAVGLYQVAFKIILALQFLPMAFSASLYPALSFYYKNNREQLGITFERAMNYLIIISFPISIGTIAVADKIVAMFSAGYGDAIWPLRITILSVPFMFMNFPIGALLNACDRQKKNTRNMAITLTSSVAMNLALIPAFGAVGASITFLATSILMFVLGIFLTRELADYRPVPIIRVFVKTIVAGLVMGLAAYFLKSFFNIFIVAGTGGIIYTLILLITGAFKKEDILSILSSFKRT
jgi:O-antigen/teichoic acid export membrane protein